MQIEKGRKKGIPKIKPIISSKGLKKKGANCPLF